MPLFLGYLSTLSSILANSHFAKATVLRRKFEQGVMTEMVVPLEDFLFDEDFPRGTPEFHVGSTSFQIIALPHDSQEHLERKLKRVHPFVQDSENMSKQFETVLSLIEAKNSPPPELAKLYEQTRQYFTRNYNPAIRQMESLGLVQTSKSIQHFLFSNAREAFTGHRPLIWGFSLRKEPGFPGYDADISALTETLQRVTDEEPRLIHVRKDCRCCS